MTEPSTRTLADALDALRNAAGAASLEQQAAVREGEALAAAVAESAEQAYLDWGEQTGHPDPQAFFDAAHRGRRWRAAPTALLGQLVLNRSPQAANYAEALAEVCRAAQTLGEPNPRTAGNAAVAAAAQLAALNPPPMPATTRPEVAAMLRALNQSSLDLSALDLSALDLSSLDLSTLDLPGGIPGLAPGGALDLLVSALSRSRAAPPSAATGSAQPTEDNSRPSPDPSPRRLTNFLQSLMPWSASPQSRQRSTGKWPCFESRRCAARRA